jgi:hypothetical protein
MYYCPRYSSKFVNCILEENMKINIRLEVPTRVTEDYGLHD